MQLLKLPIKVRERERVFEPHLNVYIESGHYLLKTVDRVSELHQALALRAKVFFEEYQVAADNPSLDVDAFDFKCDHLVIVDRRTREVVGTYRILCSEFTDQFYSATEFEISDFLKTPGIKLELGRACIAKEHRRGAVLSLLWRGIIRYAVEMNAEFLFGCSSVKSESKTEIDQLLTKFRQEGMTSGEWIVNPLPKYQFRLGSETASLGSIEVPPLLRTYFAAGAKVIGEGAWDRDFHCTDLFTVLRVSELAGEYGKRYDL